MTQMTLRQIPSALEAELRRHALKTGQSLNKTILYLLRKSLGFSGSGEVKRDLSSLAGTWSKNDEKEFEKNTSGFNKIEDDLWDV